MKSIFSTTDGLSPLSPLPRTPSMSFQQCWWLERTRLVNVIALKRHVSRLIIIVHVLQFVGVDLLSACTISSCWLSWWRYSLCNISSTQFDATKRRTHWLIAVIHFYGESQEDVSIITSSIVTWKETVRELTPAENSMGMRMRWVWRWWCKYCNDKKTETYHWSLVVGWQVVVSKTCMSI